MKFAVVLATIFVCAQGSAILPYAAWNALPYAANAWAPAPWAAPITQYSTYPAAHVVAAPAISYAAHVAAPSAYIAHAPAVHVAHAPVAKIIAAPVAASYTAANRGSVHTAPLPGHAVSQTSLNLAPAPGTH